MLDTHNGCKELTYVQAVNAALDRALAQFPEAIFFGEDVALPGGVFGASKGLSKKYGERVFDTPISETAILGAAIGAAMVGRRPIVEIMWADFLFVAFDQIVNQAPHLRYLSRGQICVPMTVRTQQGAWTSSSLHHSRCVEAMLAHVPGLRIALPATPGDAYSLLLAAIANDDPVIVIEHRGLYSTKGDVHLDAAIEEIGEARTLRPGTDVTLVALSRMVPEALRAADALAEDGVSVEVIDARWISPFDYEAVFASLERTNRLVIVHEAVHTAGFGAEIAARVAEDAFWSLDAPIVRVTTPDLPKPSAPSLERAVIPDAARIANAIRASLRG
jgi:pyruvate/2-oxoglutarate/acetoin dehydrogenase E1 component